MMINSKSLKITGKKFILTSLAAISLMGVGVGITTAVLNAQPTEVSTATDLGYLIRDYTPSEGDYKHSVPLPMLDLKVGQTKTIKVPQIKGYTSNVKTVKITEYGPYSMLSNYFYYTKNKSTPKAPAKDPVSYKSQKSSMQVRLVPGHDFYNHVPGSKYNDKRTHYGKTYKGRTVTINMTAKRPGVKTPYYRCVVGGKTIGWIYGGALVNVAKYKTVKKTATVVSKPTNNFYNHVTSSIYATKLTHFGKTYRNRKVTINMQATRQGTKTPYYRCSVNGKSIGWIYGRALSNVR
ncbi:GW dipeptide domain-containing protein [Pediococcus damnosus]|uniref:Bifunctional autolysin Atl n=1 Tax=Pediococcus damnosus TaxID=51663 RepID=A0AAC9B2K1_9LACO|nr:GW dipeptide domain-containing protein [Pediococcus damnosus]AMV63191.1 Bifunctional autolysin Atl [Pediococcus damnosus]